MIFFNVIRIESGFIEVFSVIKILEDCSLYRIVEVVCKENYNLYVKLNYFVMFILNLM